ncbi:SIP domain-containing protein [Umezawaea sp. Da 62-37]|uniref:SIP domain-containing protein n=1 Tax=Umezawaea sp. Da 62-37 TaxID=3075927 RepID=UPI0037DCC8FC
MAYRKGASARSSPALPAALRALPLPVEPGIAHVAGEARTYQQVRVHLLHDCTWPRKNVLLQAFWTAPR